MGLDILVGGEWRKGRGNSYASIYPADGSVNAELNAASAEDAAEAVERTHEAWKKANWRDAKPHERATVLFRVAETIRARHEELAQLQRQDNGKPISETRALTTSAANTFQYMAAACETMDEELTPSRGDYVTMSLYEPMGVIAAITPWNSPIASEAQKMAPALAAGNAVVMKPAEVTPLIALELAKICGQAGVPKGIISVLPGKGSVIGDVIVKHPLVRKVSFTGGVTTGRGIAHHAAEKLMPVSLELGGKSPTIVFDDCDLDIAVKGVLFGIFSSSGEACIAGSRLFVQKGIKDAFMERLVAATKRIRIGDPKDPATHMGPLITPQHRSTVDGYVKLGLEEGGRILTGGKIPEGALYEKGFFYEPTIFEGLGNQTRTCQEEIFGPVLAAMEFGDEGDLLAQANDSVFGLASGIWTKDYKRAWRIAKALEAATVWINTYKQFSISTPFSGYKESGLGSEKGRLGIRQYMNQKSLYWGMSAAPMGWGD